jgi:hypothetical protein
MNVEITTDPATKVRTATIVVVGDELDALNNVCADYPESWPVTWASAERMIAETITESLDVWNPANRPPPPAPPAPAPAPRPVAVNPSRDSGMSILTAAELEALSITYKEN